MILISHRGNLSGQNETQENTRKYIDDALRGGYHAEIDVRFKDGHLWMGHDEPDEKVSLAWLFKNANTLWIHCKDIESIMLLNEVDDGSLNYFGHSSDDFVLTSKGFLFCLPSDVLNHRCVLVMPEFFGFEMKEDNAAYAVLTDFPSTFKEEQT